MPKITISSSRVYYHELHHEDRFSILHDISLYQSMLHKSYRELYHDHSITSKYLKNLYHTNDYFPLSAISEAKGILKSQKTWYKKNISLNKKQLSKVDRKIQREEQLLREYRKTKQSLIAYSKAIKHNQALPSLHRCCGLSYYADNICCFNAQMMSLYIFEVGYLNPLMKSTSHKIRLLKYRRTRLEEKIIKLEKKMKAIHFRNNRYMKITGRAQGKYCNNIFKYNDETKEMTYIDTSKRRIVFPLIFPYRGEELSRVLKLPHATKVKAVCYTLVDKGEYFIIYATVELDIHYSDCMFEITNGVVGIDINSDHIALSETDAQGNMIHCHEIPFTLDRKTTHQRNWIIEDIAKQVLDYCVSVNKPLIMEQLNFEKKKKEFRLYNKNRKYHHMLSEFSYRKITEKLYSRAYKVKIGINEVNPAYTSVIGQLKYAKRKGISVHKAASYVIARRGMGYGERLSRRKYGNINEPLMTRWRKYSIITNR